jgi:hypothetical protein
MDAAPHSFASRRFWNLWDMFETFGEDVFMAVESVTRRGFDAYRPEEANLRLADLPDQEWVKQYVEVALDDLKHLRGGCKLLGAKLTDMRAAQFEDELKKGSIVRSTLNNSWADIRSRFRDELISISFFVLDNKYKVHLVTPADMSEKPLLFGVELAVLYPSAEYEIEETAKCLAFERSTAAVFHLMRIMEIGLKAVSKCLQIADPTKEAEKNWGVMLRKIKDEIDRRNKAAPPEWSKFEDRRLMAEIYVSLDAVRNVWRNATMHVETKYTMEEAEHILNAVRGFMTKLSSRMNEEGKPLASDPP